MPEEKFMIDPENKQPTYEELVQQNQVLLQELSDLKAEKKAIWMMLAGTNRRLQMSSAAIKAAVSSMLNYDIFWDGANQHEFLKTINTSIDQASKLIKLLTLAYRLEAGNLVLRREHQVLQEIISVVQDHITTRFPHLVLGLTLPQEGAPALVDYELLMMALEFLFEVFEQMGVRRVGIQAVEEPNRWVLKFEGLEADPIQMIQNAYDPRLNPAPESKTLPPEHLLRLYITFQILQLQDIQVAFPDASHPTKLCLIVPIQFLS